MNRRKESILIIALVVISSFLYLIFIYKNINYDHIILALCYLVFQILMVLLLIIYIINNLNYIIPDRKLLPQGDEPLIGIIIPTWNEPLTILENTIRSIFIQDYPLNKIIIIVTDDGRQKEVYKLVEQLSKEFSPSRILYNRPPKKDSAFREGEGKAGNLNSAFRQLEKTYGKELRFIETRDADDIVIYKSFLRDTIAQLISDKRLAFVQTIKAVFHSKKDPFGNLEQLFYLSLMLSKNATDSVFPCGSGLIWRKDALIDIGLFPTWNIVEDFQSGVEAHRRRWKGIYIPIIGAVGQIAPEDLPNLYKQRGTWALDSFRFLFWGKKRGLNIRQILNFIEPGIFYLLSALTYLFSFVPSICLLLGIHIIQANFLEFIFYHLSYLLNIYLFSLFLVNRSNATLTSFIRSLEIFFGLGPVYLIALIKSFIYGKNKKPKYIVTRKSIIPGFYIYLVSPQFLSVGLSLFAILYHLKKYNNISYIDWGNILWALFFILIYSRIIRNSWFKFKIL